MNLRTVVPPSEEPISLVEARLQCKVDADPGTSPPSHPDDSLIDTLITAAREHVEDTCNVILTDATYEWRTSCFQSVLLLPRGPVNEIAWVKYLDDNEQLQTVSDSVYFLDDNPWQASIGLKKGQSWPTAHARDDAVRVQFTGGFLSPNPIPKKLVLAIKMLVGHWYKNRDAASKAQQFEVPIGASVLMMSQRRGMGV